jgi:hypothetical protein
MLKNFLEKNILGKITHVAPPPPKKGGLTGGGMGGYGGGVYHILCS